MSHTAILLFGEGKTERLFLQHLKNIYGQRGFDFSYIVDKSTGGSPENIVNDAYKKIGSFDYCCILMDDDLPLSNIKLSKLKKNPISGIFLSSPCVEGLFIKILDPNINKQKIRTSALCKSHFNNTYLGTNSNKLVMLRLKKKLPTLFPRVVLEKARTRCVSLNHLIDAIQNGSVLPQIYPT